MILFDRPQDLANQLCVFAGSVAAAYSANVGWGDAGVTVEDSHGQLPVVGGMAS